MKAIVYPKYGSLDVLRLKDVAKPTHGEDQVLVKVMAASVNPMDTWPFVLPPFLVGLMEGSLSKPRHSILGADIAGRVEAAGAAVTQFRPGDEVFGVAGGSVGGLAEYACTTEKNLALKPANQSFEAAACVPVAGLTALQGLRDAGRIRAGQKVLINGASGGVGTFALQIAKSYGAEVTAVCSTRNLGTARLLGADHVIDYAKEDFTRKEEGYDLIFAVNSYHHLRDYRRALKPGGMLIVVGGSLAQIFQGMLLGPLVSLGGSRKLGSMGIAKVNHLDFTSLGELLEAGKIAPVIDRTYPLSEGVAALCYHKEGHTRGKIVIKIA